MLLEGAKNGLLPEGENWGYEAKLDGYRIVADMAGRHPLLQTRNGNNFTDQYPTVVDQLPAAVADHRVVLDGEMVGIDNQGQHSIDVLRTKHPRVVYYVFDLLELDGATLVGEPLSQRRELLGQLFEPQESVELSKVFPDRDPFVRAAKEHHLEGVVAKKLTSLYHPGRRSSNWQKLRFEPHTRHWKRSN